MNIKYRWALSFSCLLPLLASASVAVAADAAAPGYHVIKRFAPGGEGGWDYLTIDPSDRRLYIARATRVMVIDLEKETLVGEVADTPGVHGVALAPKLGRGLASNGRDGSVTSFDTKTLKERTRIKVDAKPDAIIYDPATTHVFAFHAGGVATVIDPEKESVIGKIELGGKAEFGVSDENGRVFVNIEDKNEVLAIDANKMSILHRWPVAPGEEPAGMAIDRAKGRLYVSCQNQKMVVLDVTTGKVIGEVAIGKGTDACVFDPESNLAFSSNGDGTLSVVRETADGKFELAETVQTAAGARTMALDPKTHQLLLVTAKAKAGQRRAYEPGTFEVLVVGK